MKRLLLPAILFSVNAGAAELTADLRLTAEAVDHNNASPYAVPERVLPSNNRRNEQNLELHWQKGGFNTTATLRNSTQADGAFDRAAFFNELYFDTQLAGRDVSIGRKIASWGVGFGFRPLDVIQQEDRRALYTNTLKGVDMLTLETYGDTSALSLLWSNPGRGKAYRPALDESLALKFFNNFGDADAHALARYSERTGAQLGVGLSLVSGDALEWHGSILWQRNFSKPINRLTLADARQPLSADNPFIDQTFHNGVKALAGVSWTHGSGWNVLGEIWYDNTAYTAQQWRNLNALNEAQRQLTNAGLAPPQGVLGNIARNRQAFRQNNLRQWNALLRLSRQSGSFEPSLELLYTPDDRGWVITARAQYTLNNQQFEAGLRRFGGDDNSTLAQLPDEGQAYISWRGSF